MVKRIFFPVVALVLLTVMPLAAQTQDTLRILQYNLLFYGFYTSSCTSQNNNVDLKDTYLRTIIAHTRPDIFAVNEMGRGVQNAARIRDNVLNYNGEDRYSHATYTNTSNSSIVNMLFYDHHKFGIVYEAVISTVLRDINLYTLYYKDPLLDGLRDTTFLSLIVAHFKAGSSVSDQQTRTAEAQAAMGFLAQHNIRGNLMFMGDFNMNSSFEQAFQLITWHPNEDVRFYDPIDLAGQWYNNPDMALHHTQSPRTGSDPCFVTGGLDDRYDMILTSASILEGSLGLQFIEGSYRAVGQDGNRFNQSLISPSNFSEPYEVIEALYLMSDHIPVYMELLTQDMATYTQHIEPAYSGRLNLINPARHTIRLQPDIPEGEYRAFLFSYKGSLVQAWPLHIAEAGQTLSLDAYGLLTGMYVLRLESAVGHAFSERLFLTYP